MHFFPKNNKKILAIFKVVFIMENPKISVIVPIYNIEAYLEDALECLAQQTLIDEMEVLMIDDGSTDSSKYIIERYALDHENFHAYHKANEGIAIARNFGLNLAKGEYIAFMDSDDFIFHDSYEKLYDMASKNQSDVVTANFLRYDSKIAWPHPIGNFVFKNLDGNIDNTSGLEYPNLFWDMPVWNKLYKREFLIGNNIQFPNRDVLFEDNIFSNEVFIKAEKVSILNDFVYCWRLGDIGSSSTQTVYLDRGKDLYEMAEIVNTLLTENIDDDEILNIKYRKLLTIDIPFYLQNIRHISKENYHIVFEGAYELASLVPDKYIGNLNNYYQVVYEIIKNKDWDDLLSIMNVNLRRNPRVPKDISEKYWDKFDFEKDAVDEDLFSYTNKIYLEENSIAMDFTNYIPFYSAKGDEEVNVILKNKDFDDFLLDSSHMKGNVLFIPADLISFGENIVYTHYKSKDFEKFDSIKTRISKNFEFDDYYIEIARGKIGSLRIIKRKKGNAEVCIENIRFEENKFIFTGFSNMQIEKILLNDCLNFKTCEYPISYKEDNSDLEFEIDYMDFAKFPIKRWELRINDDFNRIFTRKEYEFFNEKFIILMKTHENKIMIEFNRYDTLKKLKDLEQNNRKLKKENKKLSKRNKKLKKNLKAYKSRKIVKFVDKIRRF